MNIWIIFGIVAAVIIGLFVGWLFASSRVSRLLSQSAGQIAQLSETRLQLEAARTDTDRLRKELVAEQALRHRAEADRQNERANLEEQKRLLNEAEAKLREAFDSLASKALQQSNEQFLHLAQQRLATFQEQATGDLAQRQESIRGLIDPLQQRLTDLQNHLGRMESNRESAYGELRTQVQGLAQSNRDLQKETGTLVNSLRQPQVKGSWGELTLRRAVELAGMSPHCDFEEQVSVDTSEGRLRPDMIIHLPGNAHVVVDAKVPRHGFIKAAGAQTDEEREEGLADHVRLLRSHVSVLSSKEYWKQFEPSPDFVVLFVPGEVFFSAALEKDPSLLEDALSNHVVLASPANLVAILRSVAYGWRQEQVAASAQEISALGRDLFERLVNFVDHISDIRSGLERANNSFNKAVGSLEARVLPTARKLKEKGIQSTSELTSVEPTETSLRLLNPGIPEIDK